jgi:hypothetical protein
VGCGQVPTLNLRRSTPTRNGTLLLWKRDKEGNNYQDFGWETPEGGSLFTRDTLEYRHPRARLSSSSPFLACYFYRRCEVMPTSFRELVEERQRCGSSQKVKGKIYKIDCQLWNGNARIQSPQQARMSFPRIVSRMQNVDAMSTLRLFHVGQVKGRNVFCRSNRADGK